MSKCGLDECDLVAGCVHDCEIDRKNNEMDEQLTPYGLRDSESEEINALVEQMKTRFSKPMEKAFEKLAEKAQEEIQFYIEEYMESDAQSNISDMVRCRVNDIIKSLLMGNEDEGKKWLAGYDLKDVIQKIYAANHEAIQNKIIDDLLKENQSQKDMLDFYRNRN